MLLILLHASVVTILKTMNIIPLYLMHRNKMLQTNINVHVHDLHIDTPLHCLSDFDCRKNKYISDAVHEFTNECERIYGEYKIRPSLLCNNMHFT